MKQLIPCINFTFLLKRVVIIFTIVAQFLGGDLKSQAFGPVVCPINAGVDQSICAPNCANLTGTFVATALPGTGANAYLQSTIPYAPDPFNAGTAVALWDDQWSQVINLPFPFCFYGNTYNQCLIGSNGVVSFNLAPAGGYCPWPIPAANAPSATYGFSNCIMGPWQDLNPVVGGSVRYATYGVAPCRRFVVSWFNVPMYSCGSPTSQQIVLYETTNVIDNFIQNRFSCAWNGNRAVQGVMNNGGTQAVVTPGRNALNAGWTTANDGKRYTPNGASNYVVGWYQGATLISSGATATVCPPATTTYTFRATYTNCNGQTVTVSDQMIVTVSTLTLSQTQTNIGCFGSCTGTAGVTVTSGTGPFTYAWAPSGGTGANATGLCAGTYTCTVTGAAGCTGQATFNITQPPAITLTPTQTNVACFGGNTGTASVVATGGTGTYTYSWAPSGGSGSSATGLTAGTYTVTVSSPVGCTATQTYNITQPPAITLTPTQTNVACFGGNTGTASVTATGGTGTYTYSWAPSGGTGSTETGLTAGSYTVTVSSPAGCTATQTYNITQPPAITLTPTQTNVACFGGNTGTASVAATGGTGTYTYSWAPSGGSGSTATGLSAGTYTVTVSSPVGCTATQTYNITQPPVLATTGTQTNVLCNGGLTGSAAVTVSGGTGPYTYAWSPSGGSSAAATGLGAGSYTVLVTDANGCTITQTYNITQPTALAATTSFTQATCSAANGSASVSVSGGTSPYTYSWSPSGGTGSTATGLSTNTYTVTYTDANGCTGTATVAVPNAASPSITVTSTTSVTCFGGSNGTATSSITGGTGPFTYSWSPSGGTSSTGTGMIAGNYTVTVTDANGCTATATTVITEPPVLTATVSSSAVLCFAGNTGSATVTATGGTGLYTYSWSPSGGTASTATGLSAGGYTVTVTDANGCTTTATTAVVQPTALTATATASPVLCFGGNTGSASVTAGGGTSGYTYSWSPSGGNGANATSLIAGVYTVTVTDANGCTLTATTSVTEPTALTATTSFTQSTCSSANGSAAVSAGGGSPGYTYSWSPSGGTASTATGLSAGGYTVTVTDANACTITASVNVLNTASPTVTITASDSVSCFGGNDGWAAVTTSGGTTPYTYLWTNADTDTLAGNLLAGSYTVTVTDANGCSSTATVAIGEPPVLTASATSTDVLCFGGNTGTGNGTAAGGTGSYSWSWIPSGGNASTASGLTAGSYTVTATDINGCTADAVITIGEPAILTVTTAGDSVLCFGGNTGSSVATATGGFGNYTYAWSPSGGSAATESSLIAGSYTVLVTDDNGCTASATATISEPSAFASTTSFTVATCGSNNGSASVAVTGGTGSYSYSWAPSGGTGSVANGLAAGSYTVTFTDANGCFDTSVVNLNNGASPVVTIAPVVNVSCFGGNDGSATASTTGGSSPYVYAWSNGDADSLAGNLIAGIYTVTVTDVFGCTGTSTVTVVEPSMLNIQATATPSSVCEGATVNLNANAGGGTPVYSINWTPGPLSGAAQSVVPAATTSYTATVTDANGCTASSTVLVTVNAAPAPVLTADVTSGCAPLCVDFSDMSTVASGTITGWLWDFGDNTTSTAQNPPMHCYSVPGNYTVVLSVTSSAGCTQTITMANYINVYAIPVAAFSAGPQPATILNPEITFTESSTNATSWLWSFGDLTNASSNAQNPTFTYQEPECYMVTLEVTSADGCQDTASAEVCIDPDVSIYVPNTFTPDGNGLNEEFIPVTIGIDPDKYELWIFDRWGNMIFYTDDLAEGWDGRVQGSSDICQVDTYVWRIKARDITGAQYNLIGHVNLIK